MYVTNGGGWNQNNISLAISEQDGAPWRRPGGPSLQGCGRSLELMHTRARFLGPAIVFFALILSVDVSLAQRPAGDAEACAACGACVSGLIMIPLVILALNIVLLVWVARDAKARGMDNAVLWMILVMVTSIFGFIIYMFSRPQGNLIQCQHCSNKRLQASAKCPHCSNP
jgi:hypothetical protein